MRWTPRDHDQLVHTPRRRVRRWAASILPAVRARAGRRATALSGRARAPRSGTVAVAVAGLLLMFPSAAPAEGATSAPGRVGVAALPAVAEALAECPTDPAAEAAPDVDWSGCDLSGADLSGADLTGADLWGADLTGADLSGATLYGASLQYAVLTGADLDGADLGEAFLYWADLSGADLTGADLEWAHLTDAVLTGATMAGVELSFAVLHNADLRYADLTMAYGFGAYLTNADLTGAILYKAEISSSDLTGATMVTTNLWNAWLWGSDLGGADLTGANLSITSFKDADLTGADLRLALFLETVLWDNTTCPDGTNSSDNGLTCVNNLDVTVDDTEAPEWSVPAGIAVATDAGAATAVVSYTATVIDDVGVVSSSCAPASGTAFGVGTTTVTCTAADAAGNVGTAVFDVTVTDGEAPQWSVPAGLTAIVTGLDGADVSYTASATDNVGVVSSSCTPGSGSTFTLGTTTVACTATDAAGNVGTASFDVTVGVDAGSVDTLIAGIADLGLPKGVERSLQAPLKRVTKLAEDENPDNDQAVCDKLDEFSANVADRLADGSLTVVQADALVAFSHALELEYGCD